MPRNLCLYFLLSLPASLSVYLSVSLSICLSISPSVSLSALAVPEVKKQPSRFQAVSRMAGLAAKADDDDDTAGAFVVNTLKKDKLVFDKNTFKVILRSWFNYLREVNRKYLLLDFLFTPHFAIVLSVYLPFCFPLSLSFISYPFLLSTFSLLSLCY